MAEISELSQTLKSPAASVLESPNVSATTEDFEFAALSVADKYRKALVAEFSQYLRGNVLEVGAGIGQITEALLAKSDIERFVSIEPHPAFYSQLLGKFPGHSIIQGTIDDLKGERNWDAIVSINVLEHIKSDETELKSYHEHLRNKGGVLCLFVPARMEIYSEIDRDFGHFRRYSKPELRQKLERAGFQIVRLRYYNLAGYFAWWLNFCLLKKRHFDAGSVRFFDRFIFPLVHAFESRICPPLVGQSLLAIARAR
ncbi:MAG TPA: methyltransferase domain-containing protein [Verrucomicrobiae bacterium]|nr:methyltransferase domain-containing protein [Verrucomicrobiae bacterium]